MRAPKRPSSDGFTLVELMVVMAIVAMLVTLALPKYMHSVARSREAVLRQDLRVLRDSIDKFQEDRGRFPASLDELVEQRYLRGVPVDPVTDRSDSWVVNGPPEGQGAEGVYDVHSGAEGDSLDGTPYAQW